MGMRKIQIFMIVLILLSLCGCFEKKSEADKMNDKGINSFYRGHYEQALTEFSQAIELDTTDARMFNNRGLVYNTLGDYKNALADYAQALKLDADFIEV